MVGSGTDAVNFHLLRQPRCTPKTLVYVLQPFIRASSDLHSVQWSLSLVVQPSFSAVLQPFILWSGPSYLRSLVVPGRGLYPRMFIHAFDYCFVHSVTH